jgi:hypothetical protein
MEILEQAVASSYHKRKRTAHHDFDDLFGSWANNPEFDEAMKDFRVIDPAGRQWH